MRTRLTLMTLVACLAAGSAGSAQADTAPDPLSPTRAETLLTVIDYAQILDASRPAPFKLARYATACRKLPRTDALIVAYRATCRAEGDAFTAGLRVPNCRSAGRCSARLARYGADLHVQAAASRRLNLVLKRTVPDAECRSALRITAKVLGTVTRLERAAKGLVRTIARGTGPKVSAGVGRFYAIDRSPLLDHRGRLDAFRAACL